MLRLPWSMMTKLGTVALIGYIAWLGWEHLGPRKPEMGPVRRELADTVIPKIVEGIRRSGQSSREAALLHFENDPTDHVTENMRRVIEERGVLDLRDRSFWEKVRNVLNLRHPGYGTVEAASARGEDLGVPCVVFGKVHAFESYPGGAKIDIDVSLVDVGSGEVLFSHRYAEQTSPSPISAEVIEKKVKQSGNSGRIYLPPNWIGKKVKIIRVD